MEAVPDHSLQIPPENSDTTPLLIFQAGGKRYALPVNDVRELMHMAQLSTPPGMPDILAGFLNLRGTAIPIVRIHPLLGLEDGPPGMYSALIILHGTEYPLGLLVDEVVEISSPAVDSHQGLRSSASFNGCSEWALETEGSLIPLLIPGRLLLEQERRGLAALQEVAQKRLSNMEVCRP